MSTTIAPTVRSATGTAETHRGGPLAGTRQLFITTMRHEGRLFAPWVLIALLLSGSSVLVFPWVFPTEQSRQALSAAIGANPATSMIFGPAYDLTTAEGFNTWRTLAIAGFLSALCAIFAVVRATRTQEDSGRAELLAAGVLGRDSRLMVGVLTALWGATVLGLVAFLGTIACGGAWEASLLLAATYTVSGWMAAGIAAVTSQLGADARSATSLAVGTVGTAVLLRGFTYTMDAPEWCIWANPMSWMMETEAGLNNNWWPLLLGVGLTVVLLVVAFVLQSRRDFGQGLIVSAPGPARGKIRGPWGLAVRLNRGMLLSWTVAALALGAAFGYLSSSMSDLLTSEPSVQQMMASGAVTEEQIVTDFLTTILSLLGIFASIPGVQIMLKLRGEELADRLEPIIATRITRQRTLAANSLLAFLFSAFFICLAGTVVGALAEQAEIGVSFTEVLRQATAMIPAVWAVVALSVLVVGAKPRAFMLA